MRATLKERQEVANYLLQLAMNIQKAVSEDTDKDITSCGPNRNRGTVTNLCPELAKTAAKLRQMQHWEYK